MARLSYLQAVSSPVVEHCPYLVDVPPADVGEEIGGEAGDFLALIPRLEAHLLVVGSEPVSNDDLEEVGAESHLPGVGK